MKPRSVWKHKMAPLIPALWLDDTDYLAIWVFDNVKGAVTLRFDNYKIWWHIDSINEKLYRKTQKLWIILLFLRRCGKMNYFISRLRIAKWGTCSSKIPRTFRTKNAICQTVICMFWKADLSTGFNGFLMKNQEDCEVWRLRTPALRRYKGNYGTRNRLKSFGTFEKQAPGYWDVLAPKTHCMLWPPHDQVLTASYRKKTVLSWEREFQILQFSHYSDFFFDFWLVSFIRTHFFFFERLWKAEHALKNMEFNKVRDK